MPKIYKYSLLHMSKYVLNHLILEQSAVMSVQLQYGTMFYNIRTLQNHPRSHHKQNATPNIPEAVRDSAIVSAERQ